VKIALVTLHFDNVGGIERCVTALCRWFVKWGHEVHVFCATAAGPHPRGARVHFVRIPRRPWGLRLLSFGLLAPRAVARHPAAPFDAVHVHTVYLGPATLSTAYSVHRVAMAAEPSPRGWARMRRWSYGLAWPVALMAEASYRRAAMLSCVSKGMARELKSRVGVPASRLGLHYIGVDGKAFRPMGGAAKAVVRRRLGMDERSFWFCFSGWNWRRKGLDTVLDALGRIGGRSRLLVIGEDPVEGTAFREAASRLGGRVLFAGRLSDPAAAMGACDAFVFPTRYDPFGMVVSEAMACGLPVLVPRQAGSSEIITAARNLQVLPRPGNPSVLASRMAALAGNSGRARRIGRLNRRTAMEWNWKRYAKEALRLYERAGRRVAQGRPS
jgi:glycosyltransferase involved in cell wall biosynthesis